ncbi:MAG TPA: serine/threonine-protein kinase, partial [Thermoanaerobaculia bacterium]
MIGSTLSHFEILERLGGSAEDALYRARDREDGSAVVVRLLSGLEPPELRRLLREARAATRLDHPNLCSIFEVTEVDGRLLLAMPFVAGESLSGRLARGPLPPPQAAHLLLQAVAGMIEAHEQGVVHGDLRPSNLRLDAAGRLKVVGFEPPGAISGATPFRAPEQLRGEAPRFASDIWALGAVLFALVAGRPPFAGADEESLVQAVLHDEPAWPEGVGKEESALLAIAAVALAKAPG